ncbi:MAG: hypothetical protein MI757_04400 [Pirellulales bacterium]|nr:hypothetical protein [Pirellulales bacterium]
MADTRPQLDLHLIAPRRLAWCLVVVVAVLAVLSLAGQVSRFWLGHPHLQGFVPAFYLDYESNVPTCYSSAALMFAAILTATIAWAMCATRAPYRVHWCVLALLRAMMSIDEVAMLHEYPIYPLRKTFNAGGFLYYTWVVPAIVFVTLLGFAYWQFLWHLPASTRRQFIIAACLYFGGAIGVEMLSGVRADVYGEDNMGYALITTVEEVLEMLGVVVLIAALAAYLPSAAGSIRILARPQTTS